MIVMNNDFTQPFNILGSKQKFHARYYGRGKGYLPPIEPLRDSPPNDLLGRVEVLEEAMRRGIPKPKIVLTSMTPRQREEIENLVGKLSYEINKLKERLVEKNDRYTIN